MEIYHGFSMVPPIQSDDSQDEGIWASFIAEIEKIYADDPIVISHPGFIHICVGEHLKLPRDGSKFRAFGARYEEGVSSPANQYVERVFRAAEEFFIGRMRCWDDDQDDKRHYLWTEIDESISSFDFDHQSAV